MEPSLCSLHTSTFCSDLHMQEVRGKQRSFIAFPKVTQLEEAEKQFWKDKEGKLLCDPNHDWS